CPTAAEIARRLLAHLPGTEEQDRTAVEGPEDLLCKCGGGRRDRSRALTDRGLRARLPAGMERLPEDAVEEDAGRAELVRDPYLTEDLSLTGDERVQARRHAEKVENGGAILQPVERGLDLGLERGQGCDRVALCRLRISGR